MTKILRVILGDQLSLGISTLADCDIKNDVILMAEVRQEASYVLHHKKKIAFVFSAMRHFAADLQEKGYRVDYIDYEHAENKGSIKAQVEHCLTHTSIDKVVIAHPGELRLLNDVKTWSESFAVPVEILPDNRFLMEQTFFSQWAKGKKQFRMEFFYREVRKRHQILMESGKPVGGKWNFDSENRKVLPKNVAVPKPQDFKLDSSTKDVIELVEKHFPQHFGSLDNFNFAVTRNQAKIVLELFIDERLKDFGQYQDAMAQGEPWLFHSHISFYLNTGLLSVEDVIEPALLAYHSGKAPLNSVEGFIRQVIGWREYIRGFYWHFMPELEVSNAMAAKRELPSFYWTGKTQMNCLKQCVTETYDNAYAHHIQRLMVLGNFALMAGIHPKHVNEWFLVVYADAYQWVELPNVSSMVLFADNGNLASKPYAASGSYINKMSNYCKSCAYNVKEKTGHQAGPFNYLYWHFIHRNKHKLENNPRMAMIYRTMQKMDQTQFTHMLEDADTFLLKLENNEEV